MKMTGNTVLITGAGTGMGLEAARQLSALGNDVIMVARNKDRLEREAAQVANSVSIPCDISDEEQVDELLQRVHRNHPHLNVLFLNAGVTHTYGLFGAEDAVAHASQEMATNY